MLASRRDKASELYCVGQMRMVFEALDVNRQGFLTPESIRHVVSVWQEASTNGIVGFIVIRPALGMPLSLDHATALNSSES